MKQSELKKGLEENIGKPDFYRFIYGRKVASGAYHLELLRLFGWSSLEQRLEISSRR